MKWTISRSQLVGISIVSLLSSASVFAQQIPIAAQNKNLRMVFRAKEKAEYEALVAQIPPAFRSKLKRSFLGLSDAKIQRLKELSKGKVDFSGIYSLDLPENRVNALRKLKALSSVIEPDVPPPVFVSDPELNGDLGWWAQAINAQPAWDLGYSGRGVTIADCDAGYHVEESDIRGNLLLDQGYDLADQDAPLVINDGRFTGHGTSVVAIMSGVHDEHGTNGIAYNSKVVPLQNFNYDMNDDLGKEEATAQCVLRAMQIPSVKVIVLENQTSQGSSETYAGTREAVRLALQAGLIIVSAGGNASVELHSEAQDDTSSIIVGALAQTGATADFSNFGSRITVAAFGENLHTLEGPDGRMNGFGGTSGATPQVAGAVALMLEANPQLQNAQVKEIFTQTRVSNESNQTVGGRLDVSAAVQRALATVGNAVVEHQAQESDNFRAEAVRILQSNI